MEGKAQPNRRVGIRPFRTFSTGRGPDGKRRLLVDQPDVHSAGHGILAKTPAIAEAKMTRQLARLQVRYPYDVWLVSFSTTRSPCFRRNGTLSWRWRKSARSATWGTFREVEKRFGDQIPTLSGRLPSTASGF